jgi:Ca2+-binding RTX toxin-like protein
MSINSSQTLAGYPDAKSTGIRDGVTLKQVSGGMVVDQDNVVIEGLEIHGELRITGDNVTVRNCKIVGNDNYAVIGYGAKGLTVEYCDISGGINGIAGSGTFRYNDISGIDNGVNVWGPSHIEGNYIHDMGFSPDGHFDGIQIDGNVSDVMITGNTVIVDATQTSAIMIDNYFGAVSNVTVDRNYVAGGGYTIYSDGRFNSSTISGVKVTNNVIGQGYWGYYMFAGNQPTQSGNQQIGTSWPVPVSDGSTQPSTPPSSEPTPAPAPTVPAGTSPDGAVIKIGTGSDTLLLKITQDAYQGDSQYAVFVDGKQVGSTLTAKALHDSGKFDTVEVNGDWAVGNHNVTVKLLNDLWGGSATADRNVYVESATYNDAAVSGSKLTVNDGSVPKTFTVNDTSTVSGPSTPAPTPSPQPAPGEIAGTSGADTLVGTTGTDTLKGLEGNDTYTVNTTGDKVVELASQGTDKVESTISYTLADNVENLQLMGSSAINGTGNDLNNILTGNDVANVLKGGGGNDTLNGWGGKDVLYGGSGKDTFQFSNQYSANGDKVMDFVHGTDKLDFSKTDANTSQSGDQAFIFDGYKSSGRNGHIWAVEDSATSVTHVYSKVGDFQSVVDLQGVNHALSASDFYL